MRFQRVVIVLLSAVVLLLALPWLPAGYRAARNGFDSLVGWDSHAKASYAAAVVENRQQIEYNEQVKELKAANLAAKRVLAAPRAPARKADHQPIRTMDVNGKTVQVVERH